MLPPRAEVVGLFDAMYFQAVWASIRRPFSVGRPVESPKPL
jgi:hypothetical protein